AESSAAFDELTRSGRVDAIERSSWPNSFRPARCIPAVEYILANRVRSDLIRGVPDALRDVDGVATPPFPPAGLRPTNHTGHRPGVLPTGFTDAGTPVSLSFVGKLWGEAETLRVAMAYQEATGFHLRRPPGF